MFENWGALAFGGQLRFGRDSMSGWSCDEKSKRECRNPHGCHCREIFALRCREEALKRRLTALQGKVGNISGRPATAAGSTRKLAN